MNQRNKCLGNMNNAPHIMAQTPVDEPTSKKPRKRTRKTAAGGAGGGAKKKNNASPAPSAPNFPLNSHFPIQYQDVMVVGEPSMMGGEYGEEDERTISRVENTQFDPNAIQTSISNIGQQMPVSMAGSLGGPPPQS
ncbi:unnamed protein product [Anisakis simplex]|uniref:F58A3.1a (inferred by orthology to a C. elegans protein) n=1 Tax=Anisakis simplex TaxID=6269 RepID=A0A0M3K0B0_ANISI|nr:unnamed protein product [Anisakis simplex]